MDGAGSGSRFQGDPIVRASSWRTWLSLVCSALTWAVVEAGAQVVVAQVGVGSGAPGRRGRRRPDVLAAEVVGGCVVLFLCDELRPLDYRPQPGRQGDDPVCVGRITTFPQSPPMPYEFIGSGERNWLTSKVLLTAVRAHPLGL
jgi:hypothetical protein